MSETETIRHALDSQRCQQYYRSALQFAEQSLGGLLGVSRGSMMGTIDLTYTRELPALLPVVT
jgi:hypothetical protein